MTSGSFDVFFRQFVTDVHSLTQENHLKSAAAAAASGRRWGKLCVSNFSGGEEIRWGGKVTFSSFSLHSSLPLQSPCPRMTGGTNAPSIRTLLRLDSDLASLSDGRREESDCRGSQGRVRFIRQSLCQHSKFNRRHFVSRPFFCL